MSTGSPIRRAALISSAAEVSVWPRELGRRGGGVVGGTAAPEEAHVLCTLYPVPEEAHVLDDGLEDNLLPERVLG